VKPQLAKVLAENVARGERLAEGFGRWISPVRQRASELAYGLLMLLIFDFGKVAPDLKEHPLTGRNLPRPFRANALVKVSDWRAQSASHLEQSSGRYTIDAAFVFVSLLVGYTNHFG
jgi:hypothetical protein